VLWLFEEGELVLLVLLNALLHSLLIASAEPKGLASNMAHTAVNSAKNTNTGEH